MNLKSVACQKARGKMNTDIQTFEICQTHGTGRDVSFSPKDQLFSKGLFGILNSPKIRTKKFDFTTMTPQVDWFSFVFWEKLKTPKRHFQINLPLKWVHPIIFASIVFHNSHLIQKCIQNQQLLLILYTLLNQMRVVKNIRHKDDRITSLWELVAESPNFKILKIFLWPCSSLVKINLILYTKALRFWDLKKSV